MASRRTSERNAREYYELKQKAVQFYKDNQVPEKLQEILNAMVYENPPDVYGRLSEYFEKVSKPVTLSKICARSVLASNGCPTIQTDVYCTIKGHDQHVSSSSLSTYSTIPENAPVERREKDEAEKAEHQKAAIDFINGPFCQALVGADPSCQKEIDNILKQTLESLKKKQEEVEQDEKVKVEIQEETPSEPKEEAKPTKGKKKAGSAKSGSVIMEEPKEVLFCGCSAVCSVSKAISNVGPAIKKVPLYEHLSSLRSEQEWPFKVTLPRVMMTALSSGRAAPGKQNMIKELYLIPKPSLTYLKGLEQVVTIYHQIGKLQFSKLGVAAYYTNDMGAFCPQYDRPDQLLDLVNEVLMALGLTLGEDVFIGLNCAAHEYYDPDKGKYEITTGVMKSGDDLIEVYADYISRYPGIALLIDPLRKQDTDAWTKLCERFSEKCYIIGEKVFPRPERLMTEGFGNLKASGASLKLQQMTSVTDMIKCAQMIREDGVCVLSTDVGEAADTYLADMAIGLEASFVKFGSPTRGEHVLLYNRLSEIAEKLESQDLVQPSPEFIFPVLKPPEPDDAASQAGSVQSEMKG